MPKLNFKKYSYYNKVKQSLWIVMFLYTPFLAAQMDSVKLPKNIRDYENKANFKVTDTTYINLLQDFAIQSRYENQEYLKIIGENIINYSKKAKYIEGEAFGNASIGVYYTDIGDPKALSFYNKTLALLENVKSKRGLLVKTYAINGFTLNSLNTGNYAKALDYYYVNLNITDQIKDHLTTSILHSDICMLYANLKMYEDAFFHIEKALSINREIDNEIEISINLAIKAYLLNQTKDYTASLAETNKVISSFEKNEMNDWLAYAYTQKGATYVGLKKYRWSLHWLHLAEAEYKKLDDDRSLIECYNTISMAYFGQETYKKAEEYALKSMSISKRINYSWGILNASKSLYNVKNQLLDYKNALIYHELMTKMSDSIFKDINKNGLIIQKTKIELNQEKKQLLVEKENDLKKQKNINYASIAIGLILFGMVMIYRNGNRIQKKLVSDLNHKTIHLEENKIILNKINNTKDKLFSIIGHDLRSPIAALQELLKMFKNGSIKKDELLDYIPKLKGDVDHIWFTLNNLLSWSQSQMKGATTNAREINLNNLAAENINFLLDIAKNKEINLYNKIPKNTIAWADENQINVVFRNLLSNALKFTPEKGIISLKIEESSQFWKISIKDSGIGMNLDTVNKIFKDDSNITTYGTNNEKGTGLGLSLCKEMIEKNSGEIWVESTLKVGSTFYFTVPKKENIKRTI